MRKLIAVALCVALVFAAAFASAETGKSTYLFCYVIDQTGMSFTVLTDRQQQYTFQKGEGMPVQSQTGALAIDDAVMVQYAGTLETNAVEQSVRVEGVTVLSTLDGWVHESTTADVIWVQMLNDDGSEGPVYGFNKESADIMVGEDGVVVGDDVQVAYLGTASDLVDGQVQNVGYVHIDVYGQIDDTME